MLLPNTQSFVLLNGALIFILILLLVTVARFLFFIVEVKGSSMNPALESGDHVLVLRYWPIQWLRKGQIVINKYEPTAYTFEHLDGSLQELLIKRIVGLPGDIVTTHISQVPPSFRSRYQSIYNNQGYREWYIPSGHYFVQGDRMGLDSRIIGPIPFRCFRGVVITKLSYNSGFRQVR